jgi:3-isopropylmalate/(R)-2-methylmalate dehydratase small subunit
VSELSNIAGRGIVLRGDDVDTDRIIPARFLRAITFEGLEHHVFEDDRKAGSHPFDETRFQGAAILLVNANFGCGSSREHAPQALHRWGIKVVIGESFAEIFFGNSTMIGMPCMTASHDDVNAMMALVERAPASEIRVDVAGGSCEIGGTRWPVSMPPKVREALLSGAWDTTGMLLERYEEVDAVSARLPYIAGF